MEILENISLAQYTTFKIGGSARFFIAANSFDELKEAGEWARKNNLPIFALGGGSNVLISDKGFKGLAIKVQVSSFKFQDDKILADAGMPLARLLTEAMNAGLSGLEWAVGIPGAIGGAIRGNAGAFGKETGTLVESAEVFDVLENKTVQCGREECGFGYRDSIFKKNPNLIILGAVFKFTKSGKENVQNLMKEYLTDRSRKNVGLGRSAGCFFKNIPWERKDLDKNMILKNFPELAQFNFKPKIATGFLIDHLGLKGKKIGGAMIPESHANYIINTGAASAEDVLMLANIAKDRVYNHYGFCLEEEVEMVGFD